MKEHGEEKGSQQYAQGGNSPDDGFGLHAWAINHPSPQGMARCANIEADLVDSMRIHFGQLLSSTQPYEARLCR